nr:uncharacterized protein LOC107438339 isoform X2 [Parasteatoda tepidariorum]
MPMPSARKKCICQLCTCGRHMCPHRKKDHVVIGDQSSAKISKQSITMEEHRKQRKQWDLSHDEMTSNVSENQGDMHSCMAESTSHAMAISVNDKGNSQQVNAAGSKRWSGKHVPKTLPIRRPDNLKSEGPGDFQTTHQQDFNRKSTVIQNSSHTIETSSSTLMQESSWNQKQTSKTKKIKKADNLTLSGSLNHETTNQSDYTGNAFKSKFSQEASHQNGSRHRPKTSLKVGGEFQSDSSYQQAYTQKKGGPDVKVKKGTSKSNLKLEGDMSFDTTSLDYNAASIQVSRASENSDGITALKPKPARPESEIKIPPVPISDETTAVTDFKQWKVERPTIRKPQDTLQLGYSSESQVTSKAEFSMSNVETSTSDYKTWEVSRPIIMKPEDNIKSGGDFSFTTTHDVDYSSAGDRLSMRKSNLEPLTERTETDSLIATSRSEVIPMEPRRENTIVIDSLHSNQESKTVMENKMITSIDSKMSDIQTSVEAHESKHENVQESIDRAQIDAAQHVSSESDITSKVVESHVQTESKATSRANQKRSEELISGIEDEDQTYVTWDEIRPKPIRPHSNLRQEGGMEFDTTNRSEFISRSVEKVQGIRPKASTKLFEGEFDSTTMNQVMFSHGQAEKVTPIRPKSNLHVEGGDFAGETTSAREFQPWNVTRPSPIVPKSNLTQEGSREFTTTTHAEFEAKHPEKVYPIRPTTTNKLAGGEMDLTTTNKAMHHEFPIERVKKIVPQSTLRMNSGDFTTETTNRSQFQEWEIERPKPIRQHSNLRQEGSMDFTTMNQLQFEEKPFEKVSQFRPHTTEKLTGEFDGTTTNQVMFGAQSGERPHMIKPKGNLELEKGTFSNETTNKSEFQQWQLSKSNVKTPRDNLQQEGDIDFTTTNKTEFYGKTGERTSEIRPKTNSMITGEFDGTTMNQIMFQNSPGEKSQPIRPKTNIRLDEGHFSDETTTNKEYQTWQYSKPSPIKPHSSLRQEGSIDFSTTNQSEFYGKTAERVTEIRPKADSFESGDFDGTTTNQVMFHNTTGARPQPIRPKTNIRLDEGHFTDETTTNKEYQAWEYSKPSLIKHHSSLRQEGSIDFSTTNKADFDGKTAERVTEIRPKADSLRTGDFDGTTMNQVMFQNTPGERPQPFRPKTNIRLDEGSFNDETTTNKEYQSWQYSKPSPIKPHSSLHQEGSIDFSTTNKTEFYGKTAEKVSEVRPKADSMITGEFDGTTTNQVMFQNTPGEKSKLIRPKTNLRLDEGHFADETTNNKEYQTWQYSKPSPIKPHSSLRQEGSIDFTTTNNTQFYGKTPERVSEIRPTDSTKIIGDGDFDGTTTNNAMFQISHAEKVKGKRPTTNITLESGKFEDITTNRREFQGYEISKTEPIRPSGNLIQEGEMDFTTSNRTDFPQKTGSKAEQIRPHPSSPLTGKFDGTTTNQTMFQSQPHIERVHDIRPKDNLRVEIGKFEGETTNTREFQQKAASKAELIKPRPSSPLTGKFDGTTTNRREFQGYEISKTEPIRPSGNLSQEGEMDFTTSNRTDFPQKTGSKAEQIRPRPSSPLTGKFDGTTTNQTMFQSQPHIERVHDIRPKDNLRVEIGKFADETTNTREFQQKAASKAELIKPRPSSPLTGKFDGTTTNQTMFQNQQHIERVHDIRPKDNLRVEIGKFEGETTNTREFQQKAASKAELIKPRPSSPLTGKFDGTTTNQSMFQNQPHIERVHDIRPKDNLRVEIGKFEGETTNTREFQQKAASKAQLIKPRPSSPLTGKFDGTTTNQSMFQSQPHIERVHDVRPKDNLRVEIGKFEGETTNTREFQQKAASKAELIKPRPSSPLTGKFDGTTTNQTMFQSQQHIERVHDVRPKDNLSVEIGKFESETTNAREFAFKAGNKQVPIKPKSTLAQEGNFDFTTSNQIEFDEKEMTSRSTPIRRKTITKTGGGEFYSTTTNQAMFQTPPVDVVRGKKPSDNLQLEGGEFQDKTTTGHEYQQWKVQKPKSFQLVSSLGQEGDLSFETTNNSEFKERSFEKVQQIRPKTSNKIEGEFDGTTTNQVMFQQPDKLERVKPIRHQNNLHVEDGKFTNETTSKREYRQWVKAGNVGVKGKKVLAAGVPSQKETVVKDTQSKSEKLQSGKANNESRKLQSQSKTSAVVEKGNVTMSNEKISTQTSNVKISDETQSKTKSSERHQRSTVVSENVTKQNTLITAQASEQTISKDISSVTTDSGAKTSKTKAIVPSGNLSLDGEMSFATTSKTDFIQKSPPSHSPQTNAAVQGRSGNLSMDGEMSFATTSKTDFIQKSPPSHSPQTNAAMQGRSGNLSMDGEMSFATTSKTDFIQKSLPSRSLQTNAAVQGRSDNLSMNGEMSFATTSKTDFIQKSTPSRSPQTNAAAQGRSGNLSMNGEMSFATTSKTDFIQKTSPSRSPQTKAAAQRRSGNLNMNGEMSFATTSKTDFVQKSPPPRGQKSNASVQARGGNINFNGDMTFTTTSQTDFSRQTESSQRQMSSATVQGRSTQAQKTTTSNSPNYESWKLADNKLLSASRASVEQRNISTKSVTAQKNEILRSPVKVPPKRFKPDDNLKIEHVPFDGESTSKMEFRKWETRKASSKKRNETLKQEGKMEFEVTSSDYSPAKAFQMHRQAAAKSKAKADQRTSIGQSGAMEFTTTQGTSYPQTSNVASRSKSMRPKSSIKLGTEETSINDSVSSTRSNPETSTSHASYMGHSTSTRTKAYRPTTSQNMSGDGMFHSETTSKSSFTAHQGSVEKVRTMRPSNHNILETGTDFMGDTTYRKSFDSSKQHCCPVVDLEAGRLPFSFNEEKNGHMFYAPQVQG